MVLLPLFNSLTMAFVQPPFGEKNTSQVFVFSWGRIGKGEKTIQMIKLKTNREVLILFIGFLLFLHSL